MIPVLVMLACGRVDYDVADLQLDVTDALPEGAETLHICVAGAGELSQGAGNGRAAFTGLPAGEPAEVTVDVLDADGALLATAGPATLDADAPWATAALLDPVERCSDAGTRAGEDEETWLLVLRFEEDGP